MASLRWRSSISRSLSCSRCHQPTVLWRRLCCSNATSLRWTNVTNSNIGESNRRETNGSGGRPQLRGYATEAPATAAKTKKVSRLASLKSQANTEGKAAAPKKVRRIFGQTPDKPIRARFAPSPTGYLHLGSLRTALFNNLVAIASNGGSFILRLEDTDQSRLVADAEERLYKDLKWLGLSWSEGPDCGGPYGPYKQSERLDIYKDHVQKLVDSGHAYRCFCKPEDLEEQKRRLHEAGKPTVYPGTCRSVSESDSQQRADAGESHIVRFKGDAFGNVSVRDAIYGPFQKKDVEEDFVLLKTDGFPTYHLANVVDDHLMKITHVIRGEEWLISTPKHVSLYKAFGWEPPTFAHLGLLINDDGTKLSKRNDSANISTYRDQGFSQIPLKIWLAGLGSSFSFDLTKPSLKGSQFPRTLKEIAEALSYKFTKGGIKLHTGTLQHYETKWRRSIVTDPRPETAIEEEALIEEKVLRPLWDTIESVTSDNTKSIFFPKQPTDSKQDEQKELVPALKSDQTRIPYLRRLYAHSATNNHTMLEDMKKFLSSNPHYFWRVPEELYRRSLLVHGYSKPILEAVDRVCDEPDLWGTNDPALLGTELGKRVAQLDPPLPSDALYRNHRLVARGDPSLPSHSASIMFNLIGREEWKHRITTVKSLVKEIEEGGSDVRLLWAQEAQRRDPDFVDEVTKSAPTKA
ncbi:unnamed protein product [Clonostachys rosea f. rosea IK726]|uniref:Glutamate--tRNA ligase, mitochondrial n=2 Tax=Bionectria ochroleuca TaxID=29856 RepID=A0A0B7JXJ8_BIOOC|nr:unnamed protein product [Clonostachys rosea f. rosea IK726]